jgi:hypothetical protein
MFLFVLLLTKTAFAIPRKASHGAIAFVLAWVAVAINYVIFHFDTKGPANLAVIFGVPSLFSLIAIAVTAHIMRSQGDQRGQEPPSMN